MMPAETLHPKTLRPETTCLRDIRPPLARDVYEFDLMVWTSARVVARKNPPLAMRQFSPKQFLREAGTGFPSEIA